MGLPVAERWFEHRQLDQGVLWLYEPHVIPFARCNIWLVKGRARDLLIDSGMGVKSLRAYLEPFLDKPLLVVATHTHFDHIGSHHEFEARAVHRKEAEILARPSRMKTLADVYVSDAILTAYPDPAFDPARYEVVGAPATRLLGEGDRIDLGDRAFEVLHLPGHSPGSVALWERPSGILFSGDAVYDGPLVDDSYHSVIEDYLASMERLRALPVVLVHAGHFPSFGRTRMIELIDDYLAGRRRPGCPLEGGTERRVHGSG